MKKQLLLLYFLGAFVVFGQDTTWVQTFTFDSIATRRANFQFPADLDTKRFEKVLMYYKLKCSPLTPWDQYNCGEWDYLAYTRVIEHTGAYDSVQKSTNKYQTNFQSPPTYVYNPNGYSQVDTYTRQENVRTGVTTTLTPLVMTADATSSSPFQVSANGSRYQFIISASELSTAGILAGDIQSLSLDVAGITGNGNLLNPRISIGATTSSTLITFFSGAMTTVYDNTHSGTGSKPELTLGTNELLFHQPFTWNGTDNLVIEFYFDRPIPSTNSILFSTQTITTNEVLSYPAKNGAISFDGTNHAMNQLSDFDLGNEFTIEFWSKGTGSAGTNTSVLEAYDTLNNRVINIHFPWSDNNIYFDAGKGSGYDRISKLATVAEIDNNWNHWAFVKNAATGTMQIYKNGALWHSGTGKTLAIDKIHRLVLGSAMNDQYFWKGKLDEFRLFNAALPPSTILANFRNKATAAHPNWNNLLVNYDFDEVEYAIDGSQNDFMLMPSDYGMYDFTELPKAGVIQEMSKPVIGFGQSLDAGTVAINEVEYQKTKEPQVVFEYGTENRHFTIENAFIALPSSSENTYDASGNLSSSAPFVGSETLTNETISYYEQPVELTNDIEIGRFITPYGINFDLGINGFTWIYDVTDYHHYLKGLVDLAAHNTQELIDLRFAFIEGIPPRDVHKREAIWSDWKSYQYSNLASNTSLPAISVPLSDTSAGFKIKSRLTGHGQVGNGACCEWVPKNHKLLIDGTQQFQWQIWEETSCGDSPNPAQGGTWPYAREGWCPGDMVKEYDHEITPFITPGGTVSINYEIDPVPANDPGQADGNYVMAMDLISYSAPNFQHDAAIVDVLNPNSYEYYRKFNPSCNSPRIILQNTGAEPLTSCIIRCWTTYGVWQEFNWTGNLGFLEKEVVEISVANPTDFWSNWSGDLKFHAQVYAVGGYPDLDEYANNNVKTVSFKRPNTINDPFFLWFQSNNKASENKFRLEDSDGNVLFERTGMSNNTDYKDTFDLDPGCYSVIIEDSDSDGLGYWYSSQVEGETNGSFIIRKVGGPAYTTFPRDFGNFHRYNFSVGFTVNIPEVDAPNAHVYIFPNPATNKCIIEAEGDIGASAELEVLDLTGRVVHQSSMKASGNFASSTIDVSHFLPGNYIVFIKSEKGVYSEKLIKL